MCEDATTFNQPLADWDTSHVKDMCGMFLNASSFNQPLAEWDVSKVIYLESTLFAGASNFNQPLADWDISNVEVTYCMFENAHGFNQSLAAWDMSHVRDMEGMFHGISNLRRLRWRMMRFCKRVRVFIGLCCCCANH